MKVYVTRDSVCAGDDGDAPHARELTVPGDISVERLVRDVLAAVPLASIQGGRATWCVASGVVIAVVAQQWAEPRFIGFPPPELADLDVVDGTVRLHFTYFAQHDPDVVADVLKRLRLRAQ